MSNTFVSSPHPKDREWLKASRQAMIVEAIRDTDKTGTLTCWERSTPQNSWQPAGPGKAVSLGRTGMVPGNGLVIWDSGQLKREGDGKTPVGIFSADMAFGYATPAEAAFVKLPYLMVEARHFCVDDPGSRHYNRIVDADLIVEKDWSSAEEMLRQDGLYRWGIFPGYNTRHVEAEAGSCIFLHLWRGPEHPTEGCTAMALADMENLLQWIDPVRCPVLVQGTVKQLPGLCNEIGLKWQADIAG